MFDAGAIVAKMVLDPTEFRQGLERVQRSVQETQDGFTRFNRRAQEAVQRTAAGMAGLGSAVDRVGRHVGQVGRNLAFLGAGMAGPVLLAFNAMKNTSPQVAAEIQRLTNVTQNFQLQLATAAVPIVERMVNVLGGLLRAFNSLDPALQTQIIQWTLVGGVMLTASGAVLAVAGKLASLSGALINAAAATVAFLGPWGLVAVATIAILAAFGKLGDVVRFTLDAIEAGLYAIGALWLTTFNFLMKSFDGLLIVLEKFVEVMAKIPGKMGEPFRSAAKDLDGFRQKLNTMIDGSAAAIEQMKTKAVAAVKGPGGMSQAFDDLMKQLEKLKAAFTQIGSTPIDFKPVSQSFGLIARAWSDTAEAMSRSFSDFFYDGITGQLRSLKEYFADFGRTVLRILTDVLAKLLLARLFGGLPGSIGAAFQALPGHADGIDEVPHDGLYRLHASERVVPKYDASKTGQEIVLNNYNMITPEAIAQALNSRPGENVVVNIIDRNSLKNGPVRKTIRRA